MILDQANIALFIGPIQVEPTTFVRAWYHTQPKDCENGGQQSRRSLMRWKVNKRGRQSRKNTFQKEEEQSIANESLKLRATEYLE